MRRFQLALLTTTLVLVACNGNAPSAQVTPQASITLDIGVPDARRDAFVGELRSAIANGLGNGSVSVSVDSYSYGYYQQANQPATALAGADLYTSALDDARRKASAVAQRLHVSLAAPDAISEELQSFPVGQALKGNAQPVTVRVMPNQPIVLYVSFSTSTPGQTITVFGISSSETQANATPKLDDVHVMITGRGKDAKTAGEAASRVEVTVRDEASKFGLPTESVHVAGTNFTQP